MTSRPSRSAFIRPVQTLVLLCLPLLLLSSCGNDRMKASRENFETAIRGDLKQHPGKQDVCGEFLSPIQSRHVDYQPSLRSESFYKRLELLQNRGYLTIKDVPASAVGPIIRVAVTDKFLQDFGEPVEQSGFFMNSPGQIKICYGTAGFKEVTDFTEPSTSLGMQMSQVDYTVTPTLKADKAWLKDQPLLDALGLGLDLKTVRRQALMILKDSGWVVGN